MYVAIKSPIVPEPKVEEPPYVDNPFAPEIFALGLAGSLARQQPVPVSAGTMETHKPLFVGMLVGVILVLVGLTYFPALALGPFAEGLH